VSAPDQAEAGEWYIRNLGARPGATPERVLIGDRLWLIFYKSEEAKPSRGGVIDAIGFSVPDVAVAVRALAAAGATIVSPLHAAPGLGRAAIVEDPYGARLDIVESPEVDGVTFHHVHLAVPDPQIALAWYVQMFGGKREALNGQISGIRYGATWLLAETGDGAPSAGHAIDHIAWRTTHLDSKAAELKDRGVVFTMAPRQFNPSVRISFVEGPAGTRIEILERTAERT
jgi:predicted enzyme related to lactoylglutathione lyase